MMKPALPYILGQPCDKNYPPSSIVKNKKKTILEIVFQEKGLTCRLILFYFSELMGFIPPAGIDQILNAGTIDQP